MLYHIVHSTPVYCGSDIILIDCYIIHYHIYKMKNINFD